MPAMTPERADAIQQIVTHSEELYAAIDSGDTQRILSAQKNLTAAAEAIWERIENSDMSGHDKAITRLLAGAAIKELPVTIQDPNNYSRIQRELRLMKSSLSLL